MLGTLRFVLASLVVFNHVWLPTANKIGLHAVAGFFVISGYLMTMILTKTYTGFDGFFRYLLNRFLRIFPLYWTICTLTVFGLLAFPAVFTNLYSLISLPKSLDVWLRNITLMNLIASPVILIPPAWSLTIECTYYILLAVALGRRRLIAVGWLAMSVAITVWLIASGAPFSQRYSTVLAGSLFFSTGSVIFYYRERLLALRLSGPAWWALLVLFSVFPIIADAIGAGRHVFGYYGATLLFLPLLISAVHAKTTRFDVWVGNLAYPIFLLHFFSVGLVRLVFPVHFKPLSTSEAVLVYATTLLLAGAVVRWFDPALDSLRGKVRPRRGVSDVRAGAARIAPV